MEGRYTDLMSGDLNTRADLKIELETLVDEEMKHVYRLTFVDAASKRLVFKKYYEKDTRLDVIYTDMLALLLDVREFLLENTIYILEALDITSIVEAASRFSVYAVKMPAAARC